MLDFKILNSLWSLQINMMRSFYLRFELNVIPISLLVFLLKWIFFLFKLKYTTHKITMSHVTNYRGQYNAPAPQTPLPPVTRPGDAALPEAQISWYNQMRSAVLHCWSAVCPQVGEPVGGEAGPDIQPASQCSASLDAKPEPQQRDDRNMSSYR